MVQLCSSRFVPFAFVHFHHFARLASNAAVRKKVRRVGKNGVETSFRIGASGGFQNIKAIALVNPRIFRSKLLRNKIPEARTVQAAQCWSR